MQVPRCLRFFARRGLAAFSATTAVLSSRSEGKSSAGDSELGVIAVQIARRVKECWMMMLGLLGAYHWRIIYCGKKKSHGCITIMQGIEAFPTQKCTKMIDYIDDCTFLHCSDGKEVELQRLGRTMRNEGQNAADGS